MGAVRNSNTRASHASVEGTNQAGNGKDSGPDASGSAGAAGSVVGAGTKSIDSPMHTDSGHDRRSSFSYLRRASERRRRLRMRNQAADTEERASQWRSIRGSESGLESDQMAHDEQIMVPADGAGEATYAPDQATYQRLRRAEPIYDEEGELVSEEPIGPGEPLGEPDYDDEQAALDGQYKGPGNVAAHGKQQRHQMSAEEQRRQSINDRLTEAVSDVIEFVREESFKRGKRHSLIRRRQAGGYSAGSGASTGGSASGAQMQHGGYGGVGEHDLDSGEGAMMGADGRSSYQRRRTMRRSPRRSAAQTKVYNDSDTGSAASLSHEQAAMFDPQYPPHHSHRAPSQQQHQKQYQAGGFGQRSSTESHNQQMARDRRFKLQQHGSMQDARHLYGGDSYVGGSALLLDQHRRHQSADARGPLESYQPGGLPPQDLYGGGGAGPGGDFNLTEEGYVDVESVPPEHQQHVVGPLAVGASPPPLPPGSADAELIAARRRREADEIDIADENEEMAIHLDSGPDSAGVGGVSSAGKGGVGERQSPIRFIAPKVAPLASPSATPVPDEKIVPPDVPYRGRRLPQIPGIIRSATGLLQSTLSARHASVESRGVGGSLAAASVAAGAAAVPPLVKPVHYVTYGPDDLDNDPSVGVHMFPTVSSSPTVKVDPTGQGVTAPPPASIGIVKKQVHESGVDLEGSASSINFPRVSFSPTHSSQVGPSKYGHQIGPGSRPGGAAMGSSAGASMIATQASGGTQSSVFGPTTSESLISDRVSLARTRRSKRDEEDNWF